MFGSLCLFFVLFAVIFFVSVFRSLCFFSVLFLVLFFVGMFVLSCVLFSIGFLLFSRKSCLAVCGYFFVLSGVLFFVPVFGSLCFFLCFLRCFFLLACLLVCAFICAFMFSSRLGRSSLVSDLPCLCPTQCRPAGRLSVLSVHP